jgi:hypothetical protein
MNGDRNGDRPARGGTRAEASAAAFLQALLETGRAILETDAARLVAAVPGRLLQRDVTGRLPRREFAALVLADRPEQEVVDARGGGLEEAVGPRAVGGLPVAVGAVVVELDLIDRAVRRRDRDGDLATSRAGASVG